MRKMNIDTISIKKHAKEMIIKKLRLFVRNYITKSKAIATLFMIKVVLNV